MRKGTVLFIIIFLFIYIGTSEWGAKATADAHRFITGKELTMAYYEGQNTQDFIRGDKVEQIPYTVGMSAIRETFMDLIIHAIPYFGATQ